MLYIVGKVILLSIKLGKNNCNISIRIGVISVLLKMVLAAIFSRWRPNATGEPRWTFFTGSPQCGLSSLKVSACPKFCSGCFLYWLDYISSVLKKKMTYRFCISKDVNLNMERAIREIDAKINVILPSNTMRVMAGTGNVCKHYTLCSGWYVTCASSILSFPFF